MYAESPMDLLPWACWTANGQASPETPALLAALEKAIALNPDHIGAIHYYIHATEASPDPKRAEPHADRLAALAPGAGHLVHMPAHTYLRLGRYHDAVLFNLKATDADATFLSICKGSNGVYPLGHVPHNWHFVVAAAGYEGNAAMTLGAAQQTAQRVDMTMLETLNPDNGWALVGLAQALKAQGKAAEAADAKARFDKSWANADLRIEASRI
jgi:tetratricopeptide (TPR) repeat protein